MDKKNLYKEGLEEGPKGKIQTEQHSKKVPNWKTLRHDGIHGTGLKKNHFHSREIDY